MPIETPATQTETTPIAAPTNSEPAAAPVVETPAAAAPPGTSTILTSEPAKADDASKVGDKPAAAPTAPETYEITVKDAEGKPVALDTDLVDALTPMAREMGWSNEQASQVAQFYSDTVLPKLAAQFDAQVSEGVQAQRAEWAAGVDTLLAEDAAKPQAERIFDGRKLADVTPVAAKAIDALGGADLRAFLEQTGLGNHPAMVKAFYQAGKAMTEDGFALGGVAPAAPKTREEKYYGSKG